MNTNELYTTLPALIVSGRKDLEIAFNTDTPEIYLQDKSLVELEGKELKEALKKPFVVMKDIVIVIKYEGKYYPFTIPKGYDWNGANVPPFAWLIIGQRTDPRFKLASCVHDFLCEHRGVIDYNRYLSTLIFETLCEYFGRFNSVKRWAMFHSVDNFQKTQGWSKEKKKKNKGVV